MDALKNFYKNYVANAQYGLLSFIIDMILILTTIVLVTFIVYRITKKKYVFLAAFGYLILIFVTLLLDTAWMKIALIPIFIFGTLAVLILHNSEVHRNNNKIQQKTTKEFIKNQNDKDKLIEVLLRTVDHFSSRKIGAIITIEKENNLNVYIQKAVPLNADVSFELLESIFHPNTALHDGATIIRGNKIMCAGAFYTPSDKADIDSHYGSRHRAAIGISEESDAFTIVVSEETGSISMTIQGSIVSDLTIERLKDCLNTHIIVQ